MLDDPNHAAMGAKGRESPFERFSDADMRALIEGFPLAWVSSRASHGATGSLLPMIGRFDAEGRLIDLIGHFGRSNPLAADLASDPGATLLFRGPEGYVSPEHAGRRDWAPTWNYVQLVVRARIFPDEALTDLALDLLLAASERQRAQPWTQDALGDRAAGMKRAIIGFRAEPVVISGRFKFGQDEAVETLRSIITAHPDPVLCAWMQRMNAARLA